jgi:hypothetical protein
MHAPPTAGIWGGKHGAYSVMVSGGYEDDVDEGENMCVVTPAILCASTDQSTERTQGRAGLEKRIDMEAATHRGGASKLRTSPSNTGITRRYG